jgi:NADPH2:quinone reductase
MNAIQIDQYGGPEELQWRNVATRSAGPGEVLVQTTAIGVNFMDIGVRTGQLWRDQALPLTPGVEGAGKVIAIGEGVRTVTVGERVAWVYAQGSYAEQVIVRADSLVSIPASVPDDLAASLMMQGVTAHHFATRFYAVKPGDVALVHAAAGGVGLLLTQIIKLRGGRVIARISSKEKETAVRAAGADDVIVSSDGRFVDDVMRLTDGEGVAVVYDGSGAATFQDSMASLRRHGVLAYYGPVLGSPPSISVAALPRSILIGFPKFSDHIVTRDMLLASVNELFDWVRSGDLKVTIGQRYPLSEAARAHSDLASRRSIGKLLLIP